MFVKFSCDLIGAAALQQCTLESDFAQAVLGGVQALDDLFSNKRTERF